MRSLVTAVEARRRLSYGAQEYDAIPYVRECH